ncbi:MAG: RIP metalloprotease RseP [Kiloniellales bacterium]
MILLGGFLGYVVPFLFILTVLVFVHEMGHYLVARRNGVRVEIFSIGFGPEIFGWNDKAQTRWKFSLIPLGGYVKMFGDINAASAPDSAVAQMSPEDRAVAFPTKRLGQRTWIVAAGPLANFIFAIVLLAGLFAFVGQPFTPALVGAVQPGSAAEQAGLQEGDVFLQMGGEGIERFEDIQLIVRLAPEQELEIVVLRDGAEVELTATPRREIYTDNFGNEQEIGLLGIQGGAPQYVKRGPVMAVWEASKETFALTAGTLKAVGQIIIGSRRAEELGGPLRIAQMSGQVAETGVVSVIWFMALLSINLGLINFFPIPMLDGGHLLFYAIEAIRGRPLGERAQEYGFRIGLAFVLGLMLFVTWNDLLRFNLFCTGGMG